MGPVWHGGGQGEAILLVSCYRRCLALADEHGVRSIAFPCISTGVYGYPLQAAAQIAMSTVQAVLQTPSSVDEVVFCCFSESDLAVYQSLL